MIGAIIGDIVGSSHEFNSIKTTKFNLFDNKSRYTDDSAMTMAASVASGPIAWSDYVALNTYIDSSSIDRTFTIHRWNPNSLWSCLDDNWSWMRRWCYHSRSQETSNQANPNPSPERSGMMMVMGRRRRSMMNSWTMHWRSWSRMTTMRTWTTKTC